MCRRKIDFDDVALCCLNRRVVERCFVWTQRPRLIRRVVIISSINLNFLPCSGTKPVTASRTVPSLNFHDPPVLPSPLDRPTVPGISWLWLRLRHHQPSPLRFPFPHLHLRFRNLTSTRPPLCKSTSDCVLLRVSDAEDGLIDETTAITGLSP